MKDRASGSIGRRLIWSGRVVFIGRDAAFEGVIANAVTAGSTVSPIVPRPSRSGPGTGRSGTGSTVVRHAWVGGRPWQHSAWRDHYGAGRGHELGTGQVIVRFGHEPNADPCLQSPSPQRGLAVRGQIRHAAAVVRQDLEAQRARTPRMKPRTSAVKARKVPPAESRCIEPDSAMEGRGCGRLE